jgi:hypothetical protein
MHRNAKLTVAAATLAASLLAAPLVLAHGPDQGGERPIMGGMMGLGMIGQMSGMMEECQGMMRAMTGERPNEQWRRPDEQGEVVPEEHGKAWPNAGDRPRVLAQLIDGEGVTRALDRGLIV